MEVLIIHLYKDGRTTQGSANDSAAQISRGITPFATCLFRFQTTIKEARVSARSWSLCFLYGLIVNYAAGENFLRKAIDVFHLAAGILTIVGTKPHLFSHQSIRFDPFLS